MNPESQISNPSPVSTGISSPGRIVAIVLNWNGGERIQRCVQSLFASREVNLNVVVIDNGSTDGSTESLDAAFPSISFIRLGKNAGLAKARNEGLRWAMEQGFEAMLFIDDDARVARDTLLQLRQTLQSSPQIGIVTPRILDGSNEKIIWYDGGVTNSFGDLVHRNMGVETNTASRKPHEIEFATGCCQLIKREVVERIGFLDEAFFVYSEDADYSFRARDAGFQITHIPAAKAWHEQSGDTKKNRGKWYRDYYVTRNKLLFFRKNLRGWRWILGIGYFKVKYVFIPIGYFLATFQWKRMQAVVAGVLDYVRGRFGERDT